MTAPTHLLRRFALKHRVFRLVRDRTLWMYVRRALREPLPEAPAVKVSGDRAVRVAIIGAGKHARHVLIPAIREINDLELVALCVRTEQSKRALESEYGVPCTLRYEGVLVRDDVDAVIIATPSSLHRYLVIDAARCGKHVMCEAPGIVAERDIAEVREAAASHPEVTIQYGHRFWYAPVYQRLKEAMGEYCGEERKEIRAVYPESAHLYGVVIYLNGAIVAVQAEGKEHDCTFHVEFANGDRGEFVPLSEETRNDTLAEEVTVSWKDEKLVASGGSVLEYVKGKSREELARFPFDISYALDHTKMADGTPAAREALTQRGYIPELEHFVHCIRTGDRPIVGIEEAAAVFRLVWAMFEAVGTGRRVEVKGD